jgi:hypothetical protein
LHALAWLGGGVVATSGARGPCRLWRLTPPPRGRSTSATLTRSHVVSRVRGMDSRTRGAHPSVGAAMLSISGRVRRTRSCGAGSRMRSNSLAVLKHRDVTCEGWRIAGRRPLEPVDRRGVPPVTRVFALILWCPEGALNAYFALLTNQGRQGFATSGRSQCAAVSGMRIPAPRDVCRGQTIRSSVDIAHVHRSHSITVAEGLVTGRLVMCGPARHLWPDRVLCASCKDYCSISRLQRRQQTLRVYGFL